jgi:outer membrane protein assembly factor BamB
VRNYYINANIDISSGRLAYADSLAVIDGKLYVADLDGNAVQVFRLSDLTYASTFIAAGGAEAGRLSLPQSAHISNNEVYITEKGNNRLSAVSKNQTRVPSYAFYNPYLAVTDADGRVYVADKNGTRLSVFDSELTVLEQRPFTGITDIAVSGNNMVFVADTDGADGSIKYYSSGGYRGELTPLDGVSKLFARGGEKSVYAIAGGVPYKVPYDGLPVPLTAPVLDGTDYDMDYEGKIFELKDNQINRYTQSGGVYALDATLTLKPLSPAYQIRKLTSLSINFHDSDSPEAIAGYGALTLADEGSDCVFVINDVAQTGVTLFDADGYTHPGADGALEVKFTEAPKTILYEYPDINKPLALLAKDARLLVLEEDLAPVSEYFSYVLYEVDYPITHYGKTYSKTLLAGYVLKDNLTPALPKTPAPYAVGRILHDNTKIYKYPFVYSAGAAVLMRGETIATAAFCYPYVDITDTGFIAVALPGGSVGFVNANGIIHQSYEVADPDKHTDATIITDNLIGAPLYVLQDGNYVLSSEPPLKNGTRIKLANKFDAGAEYTEVIIYNDFGQLRGYVETKYVDTDSASILQVTALVIIVITVASGVILYAYYRSRRRRVDASA